MAVWLILVKYLCGEQATPVSFRQLIVMRAMEHLSLA